MAIDTHVFYKIPSLFSIEPSSDSGEWKVEMMFINDKIIVFPAQYGIKGDKSTVIKNRDTFIDNLLGRTWEMKVTNARIKWQRYCDQKNDELRRNEYIQNKYEEY